MLPEALAQALIVSLPLFSFLPSAGCLKEGASVLSGNSRKLRLVPLQLKI